MSSGGSGSFELLDHPDLESLASTHACVRELIARNERLEADLVRLACFEDLRKLLASGPALLPGATVSLYSRAHGRFLRSKDGCVDAGGGKIKYDDLPPASKWGAERFVVGDEGDGRISLRTLCGRFVRVHETWVNAAFPEGGEHLFNASKCGDNGEVTLQNIRSGLYLSLGNDANVHTASQPSSYERFVVKMHDFA